MTALGIDLGGTKIEAQLFDADWRVLDRHRTATPQDYPALVATLVQMIERMTGLANDTVPIGIGAAGLVHPDTGLVLAANLCANERPLPADLQAAVGAPITYINDCRATALSEAVFGAGQGHDTVLSLTFGTGVGGGIAVKGALLRGPTLTGGEVGHCAAPAAIIAAHGLPVFPCGCGRAGCIETYLSGPGISRMSEALTGTALSPKDVAARTTKDASRVWQVWCALAGDMLRNLILTVDPDVIVLSGGLSNISGLTIDLTAAATQAQIGAFAVPPIVLAQGGDSSGARGAAYAAWGMPNG